MVAMDSASTPINSLIQPTIPELETGAYDSWSIRMKALLISQNLWELVEEGYQEPADQEELSQWSSTELMEHKQNKTKDLRALCFLLEGVDPAIFPNVLLAQTSQEAWKILESKFKGSDKVSKEKNKKGHPSAPKKLVTASNTASAPAPSSTSPKGKNPLPDSSNGKRNNPDESKGIPKEIFHTIDGSERKFQLIDCKKLCTCYGCKTQATGRIYHSEQGNLNLHINCVFPKSTVTLDFSNGDTFEFVEKLPGNCRADCTSCHRRCEVCAKPAEGYVYHCEKDDRNVHPCCINIPKKLQIGELEFELTCERQCKKCMLCKTNIVEDSVTGNRGWFYVSECKQYRFHAFCSTKMLLEEWEKADPNLDLMSLDNAKLKKRLVKQKRKKGEIYVKIIKKIFEVLVSILIGDPTTIVVSLLLGLVD